MSTAITISRPDPSGVTVEVGVEDAGPRRLADSGAKRYWDARARRFAGRGFGLGAVCSYGMPWFYNWHIHLLQSRALRRWLASGPRRTVLEIGCGVGRWTRRLSRSGHQVVGLDLSATMIREARSRAHAGEVESRCQFLVADSSNIPLRARFDRILGVTVLQHVLDPDRFRACLANLRRCLADEGLLVLLEAAPSHATQRCNSQVFVARTERDYLDAFAAAGLLCLSVEAVDPAPFKTWFLPWYAMLPRPLAMALLFAITVLALPIDLLAVRWGRATAWHKVFVLARAGDQHQ